MLLSDSTTDSQNTRMRAVKKGKIQELTQTRAVFRLESFLKSSHPETCNSRKFTAWLVALGDGCYWRPKGGRISCTKDMEALECSISEFRTRRTDDHHQAACFPSVELWSSLFDVLNIAGNWCLNLQQSARCDQSRLNVRVCSTWSVGTYLSDFWLFAIFGHLQHFCLGNE